MRKGRLDLTGQRKQFADPFAGPAIEKKGVPKAESINLSIYQKPSTDNSLEPSSSIDTQKEIAETSTCLSTMSVNEQKHCVQPTEDSSSESTSIRFYPKTSPGADLTVENTSLRTQRYKIKTSSKARSSNLENGLTEDDKNLDPKASLMTMLSKPRPPIETIVSRDVRDAMLKTTSDKKDDSQLDPRAALMAMLSKRTLPITDEHESESPYTTKDSKDANDKRNENDEREGDEQRASSSNILPQLNPPQSDDTLSESHDLIIDDQDAVAELANDENKDDEPRAALLTMLSKRSLSTTDELEYESSNSAKRDEDAKDRFRNDEIQPEFLAAFSAKLSNQNPHESSGLHKEFSIKDEDSKVKYPLSKNIGQAKTDPMTEVEEVKGEPALDQTIEEAHSDHKSPKEEATHDGMHRRVLLDANPEPMNMSNLPNSLDETAQTMEESKTIQIQSVPSLHHAGDNKCSNPNKNKCNVDFSSNISTVAANTAKEKAASKRGKLESQFVSTRPTTVPTGIAEMAAAAARAKIHPYETFIEYDTSELHTTETKTKSDKQGAEDNAAESSSDFQINLKREYEKDRSEHFSSDYHIVIKES
jgi:hypothetical protein